MRTLRAVVWATSFLLASTCVAQKPEAAVRAEVQRLKAIVASAPEGGMWKDIQPMASESLANSEAALERGRLYLSLLELDRAQQLIIGAHRVDGPAKDSTAFEREWTDQRAQLAALIRTSESKDWNAPLAVHALEEAARGQVLPIVDAGKAYAPVTELKYGFFYIGEAQGAADFSHMLRATIFATAPDKPVVRSVHPELLALQQRANAAFKPPLSNDKHPQFIRLNSTLKLAEELDSAGLYAGAMYEFLTAVVQFAAVQAAPVEAAKQAELRERVAAEFQKRSNSSDDSLRELFLEQAEAAVLKQTSTPADLLRASLVLDAALPAYTDLVRGSMKAPVLEATQLATVTLVRWPYT